MEEPNENEEAPEGEEISDRTAIAKSQQKTLDDTQSNMDELTRMRYRKQIEDEEFLKEKTRLKIEITSLRQAVRETELRIDKTNEILERIFNFASNIKGRFDNGSIQDKKEIFIGMGGNCKLTDKKLSIDKHLWLIPIENKKESVEAAMKEWVLEKTNGVATKRSFDKVNLMLRDLVNSVRTAIKNYDGYVYIPDLREYMPIELKNLSSQADSEIIP